MSKLTLVIMAAGMGSRYGGMKQLDRFGANGEILMEYSIYDALKAGFERVVIIIKEEMLADFKETAGDRLTKGGVELAYAFQRKTDVPEWFQIPEERIKPWGTAQAVAATDGIVKGPFCVINADDFYGSESFAIVADYLKKAPEGSSPYNCCMAGYRVENTLSENGTVTRGVCEVNGTKLVRLAERYKIHRRDDGIIIDEDSNTIIPEGTSVSMNLFGFQEAIPALLCERFDNWLKTSNVLKDEYLLPVEVGSMVSENTITVDVLPTAAKWYGVTYKEDKAPLVAKIQEMISAGEYPSSLWGKKGII